jgi:hypothetical protein
MQISVRLSNLDNVIRGVRRFGAALLGVNKRAMDRAMRKAGRKARGFFPAGAVMGYDVPPRGDYQRTGEYGVSFHVYETRTGARLEVGAAYARYVGGDSEGQGQAWMHRGRWPVISDAVNEELDALVQEVDADLSAVIRQEGIGL